MKLQKVGGSGFNAIDDPPLILDKAAEFVHFHQREILHRAHDFPDLVEATQSNFKVAAAAHGLPLASLALVASASGTEILPPDPAFASFDVSRTSGINFFHSSRGVSRASPALCTDSAKRCSAGAICSIGRHSRKPSL